jgi:hypothetical protein
MLKLRSSFLVLSFLALAGPAAAQEEPVPTNVVVVNTPLPVDGTVDVASLPPERTAVAANAQAHVTLVYDRTHLAFVRVHMNGATAPGPFRVPANHALILTDATFAAPGGGAIPELWALIIRSAPGDLDDPSTGAAVVVAYAVTQPGATIGTVRLASGVAIGPGRRLRSFFQFPNGGGGDQLSAIAHGYLVPLTQTPR